MKRMEWVPHKVCTASITIHPSYAGNETLGITHKVPTPLPSLSSPALHLGRSRRPGGGLTCVLLEPDGPGRRGPLEELGAAVPPAQVL